VFKQIIKKCQKWVIWLNIITVLLSIVALIIAFFTTSNKEDFWSLAMLCGAFIFTTVLLFVSEILGAMCMDDVYLTNEDIQIKNGNKMLGEISYAKITAILIDGMRGDLNSGTVHDKNRRPKACMSIYYAEDATSKIFCRSKSNTPPYAKSIDGWYSYPLNANHLAIILNKTNALVYISEQILKARKDELKEILDNFSDRVTVAYYDKTEKEEKKAPYTAVKDWF